MRRIMIRRQGAWLLRWWAPLASAVAVASGSAAMAAPAVLDFEDFPAGTTISTEYNAQGVLFDRAYLSNAAFFSFNTVAHSGTRVLRSDNPINEFHSPPLVITFLSAQSRVRMFAGSEVVPINATLQAFDGNGAPVGQDGPREVAADVFDTEFQITASAPTIMRVELQYEGTAFEAIDDLEFEGEPPPPPVTEPPIVEITAPVDGSDLDVSTIDIAGTVRGEGLLSIVTMTIEWNRPPESTAPPFTSTLALTGTGTTREFSLPGFTGVPLGPITITVKAENSGGKKGTGSITFTNLPSGIRSRFMAQGGAAVLGAFRFGLFLSGCKMAVYENGAISDAKLLVSGDILTKWLALRTLSNPEGFGCPLGDERDAVGGARVQAFTGGRIYANLPGTAYVPAVFVDALSKRGDEQDNGLPLADPTDSAGAMRTWLFQQFARPGQTELPSTLEIRGTPPVLWMERQGGAWFLPALEPSDVDAALNRSAATLWESFPCSGNLGPCSVDEEPPFPPENISNAGDLFCDGTTYWPGHLGGPPEWAAVPSFKGDWVATPAFGAIVSNFLADIDNVFTHEHTFGNCPYCPDTIGGATTPIGGVCPTCPSDYEFKIRPIGPQPGAFPHPSLFGKENLENIKVEYEAYYAAEAHNFLGAPRKGDLVYATGRWIIDCGHGTYKSELHPVFSFATMKTVVSETNPFTKLEEILFGGKQATRVAIWVNGWYTGNPAIEFDIFPPPRPSPDAVLHVVKPVDFAAGGYTAAQDVTMEFSLDPPGAASHVHLKFTSPYRENVVTDAGEMMFETGRQYWGKWYLYWSP